MVGTRAPLRSGGRNGTLHDFTAYGMPTSLMTSAGTDFRCALFAQNADTSHPTGLLHTKGDFLDTQHL